MFNKQITEFNDNLLNLREFVDLIEPVLFEKFKQNEKQLQPFLIVGVLNKILNNPEFKSDEKTEEILKIKQQIEDTIEEKYKGKVDIEINEASTDGNEIRIDGFKIKSNIKVAKNLEEILKKNDHIDHLYKTTFISLISTIEWFFSQILHQFYATSPHEAQLEKKTLTFQALRDFATIKDAEQYLIEDKIENILRDKVENWFDMLASDLKLSMGYLKETKCEIIEIFQRRNVIVHNGGVVNSIYLSKVNPKFKIGVALNDKLKVDKSYLDKSISRLQHAFILIASEIWKKHAANDKDRGELLGDIIYENVKNERWDIALGISVFLIQDAKMDNIDKLLAQLNHWLCKKNIGLNAEVQNEIKDLDYSDKKAIYKLALCALKDDINSFINLLPNVFDNNEIDIERLEEYPIFKDMRQTVEFERFKKTSKYYKAKKKITKKQNVIVS